MTEVRVRLDRGGSLAIPAEKHKALDWQEGDELLLRPKDSGLQVIAVDKAIAQAQALVRRYTPEGRSLAEELVAERQSEADHE